MPPGPSSVCPNAAVIRKRDPRNACAAVAPRQTTTRGPTARSSASSHGRHAPTSRVSGFVCMRRFPRGDHLKCFTAFVTYVSTRETLARASAASSTAPAGPTNGRPSTSSRSPGCSPTMKIVAPRVPSPNTVCVARA